MFDDKIFPYTKSSLYDFIFLLKTTNTLLINSLLDFEFTLFFYTNNRQIGSILS